MFFNYLSTNKLHNYDVKTEITSGITAFITICYILAVVPSVLATTGIDQTGAFTATALITALSTLVSAVTSRQPYILGPSLGLNAIFAFTLVANCGYTGAQALTLLLIEGLLFLTLVMGNIHRYILEAIPSSLRNALVAGIGMFISFVGLRNSGIVVASPNTLVRMGAITPSFLIGILSILLSGILIIRNVKGAMFFSILICTLLGIPFGVTSIPNDFMPFSVPAIPSATTLDFSILTTAPTDSAIIIFTLLLINVFDALGGLLGVSSYTGDSGDNEQHHVKKAFTACSLGTIIGSILGMSPISVMAESSSGAASGAKTGLSAVVVALLFITALFLSPLFMLIPMSAITGCLVIVGVYMISSVMKIDFNDMSEALPAYMTILATVLTFSIADGICFGIVTYVLVKLFTRRTQDLTIPMCILALLFIIKEII